MNDRIRFTSAPELGSFRRLTRCALGLATLLGSAGSALAANDPPPGAAVPPPAKPAADKPAADKPATDKAAPAEKPPAPEKSPSAAPATPPAAPAAAAAAADDDGEDGEDGEARKDQKAGDSDASPAAPPPNTTPQVILESRKLAPAPAAPERPDPNSVDDGQMGSHQAHWLLSLGWRQGFVSNSGLDPFSDDNSVPQFSLGAGRTLLADGNLSLAVLALWDWGSLESTARGAKTELSINRLTLGAEGRYHIFRRLYAFGRLAPGALNFSASLDDAVVGINRTASAWSFAGDLSAGAAFEFAGDNRGASTRPRAWVGFDGGYGWAGSSKVSLEPEEEAGAPVRSQPLNFGELAVRGPFIRFSVNGTY